MKQNKIYIGLDVDDTQYHGAAFNKETGEILDFKYWPTLKGLVQQLDRMARQSTSLISLLMQLKLCEENTSSKLKPMN